MDRGSNALKSHLSKATKMEMRQTRRGWFQECLLGCEARTEFKYLNAEGTQIAHSLEDASFCCRMCCAPNHPFTMEVKDLKTNAEMLTVHKPFSYCGASPIKCCCYQNATVTSGGQPMGAIQEDCYFCFPKYTLSDGKGNPVYKLQLIGGCCGCTEGNPCGQGFGKVPFGVYPIDQEETGGNAPYVGKILKKPKSLATELFTDSNAFEVTFPKDATTDKKALLVGTSIFINAIFFEGKK